MPRGHSVRGQRPPQGNENPSRHNSIDRERPASPTEIAATEAPANNRRERNPPAAVSRRPWPGISRPFGGKRPRRGTPDIHASTSNSRNGRRTDLRAFAHVPGRG